MKVAVYTISLNEAAHVERWASSAADADYRIVADTGSSDHTVERLVRAGVTVHRIAVRPWRFDDARNAAMALIPSDVDVCCTMDMDMYLEPGWRPKLEAAWAPETTALYCRMVSTSTYPAKNFHRRWGYRFKRPVHEALFFSGDEVTRACDGIVAHHDRTTATNHEQYIRLMELAQKEEPHDAQICFWLGRELMWANQDDRAAEFLQRYLSLPASEWADERSEAMRCLARVRPEQKMFWLDKARIEAPHRREIWLDLAEELHGKADWSSLFWTCINGIEKTHRTGSYLDDNHCWGFRLFDLGAIAAWHLNVMDRAVEWAQKALELALDDQRERLQNNLDFFIRRQRELRTGGNERNTEQRTTPILPRPEQSSNARSVFDSLNVEHEFKSLDLTRHTHPTPLCELMSTFGSDKAGPFHNYTTLYDRLFVKFREKPLAIFELGLGSNKVGAPSSMPPQFKPGASLRAWRAYFPSAMIYGADIDRDILFADDRIRNFWVDQTNADTIRTLWQQLDSVSFDIMIDDGLHDAAANICFFMCSLQKLKPGGIYVVEDIRPIDIGIMDSFVRSIAYASKYAILESMFHPQNNVDNRVMIFQKL